MDTDRLKTTVSDKPFWVANQTANKWKLWKKKLRISIKKHIEINYSQKHAAAVIIKTLENLIWEFNYVEDAAFSWTNKISDVAKEFQ